MPLGAKAAKLSKKLMLTAFSAHLHELWQRGLPGKRWLLAVSGGVDSVTLAHLCAHWQAKHPDWQFGIAHMNFQLRGQASDQDQALVEALAASYGWPWYTRAVDTAAYMQAYRCSVQMAARSLRYEWFAELLAEGWDGLMTAHHRDDMAETLVLNLVRGTGIAGLQGIGSKGTRLRPLLPFGKAELLAYAQTQGLQWREDASNVEVKYKRNWVRHKVLPAMRELNPNLEQTLARSADRWQELTLLLQREREVFEAQHCLTLPHGKYVAIEALQNHPAPKNILCEILAPYGFSYAQIQQVWATTTAQAGKVFASTTHQLLKDRTHFILCPLTDQTLPTIEIQSPESFPIQLGFGCLEADFVEQIPPKPPPTSLYLDAQKLDWPLVLRPWQAGERLYPYGLKGSQKISDILINHKVPLLLKKYVYLLATAQGQPLWLLGLRADRRWAVDNKADKILEIKYIPTK